MDVEKTGAYLICRIGVRRCAVPVSHVAETMRPLPVEPLADMPAFVLGVAIIRGGAVPVLDAGRLVGAPCQNATRFVTIKVAGRVAALAVDSVLDVRPLPPDAVAAVPALLGEASAALVAAVGALDAELLLVLQAARLVPEAVWSSVQAARARA
jgi:purine-binding chemotaxis protein CheW